ncbi:hypothetical protein ALC62_08020, partial [Cyphomyrmex costatus]
TRGCEEVEQVVQARGWSDFFASLARSFARIGGGYAPYAVVATVAFPSPVSEHQVGTAQAQSSPRSPPPRLPTPSPPMLPPPPTAPRPLPLPPTTRDWTTSLMESSFFSRKMFIGGLSWQTSPDLATADNPTSKRVFLREMTVIPGHPVYPATLPRIEESSEGTDGSFHNECRVLEDTVLREVMKRHVPIIRIRSVLNGRSSGYLPVCSKRSCDVTRVQRDVTRSVSYTPTSGIGRAPRCPIAVPSDYNEFFIPTVRIFRSMNDPILLIVTLQIHFIVLRQSFDSLWEGFHEQRGRQNSLCAYLGRISAYRNRARRLRIVVRLIYDPLESGVPSHRLFFSAGWLLGRLVADGRAKIAVNAANGDLAAHPRSGDDPVCRMISIIATCRCKLYIVACILTVTVKLSINDNSLSREAGSTTRIVNNSTLIALRNNPRLNLWLHRSLYLTRYECRDDDALLAFLLFLFNVTLIYITNCALHCVLLRNDVELDSHVLSFIPYSDCVWKLRLYYSSGKERVKYGQTLAIRFKESINRAVRKRTSKGAKRERDRNMERDSSAIVRCINNAGGTRFRALYCRSMHISARSSIVQNLSGLRTTCPFTGYIASRRRRPRRRDVGSGAKAPRITCR